MKLSNEIVKAVAHYEKQIKSLINMIHLARLEIVDAFVGERKKRRLSLRKAAKLLGISAPYLSDLESGRRELSLNMFEKIKNF